MQNRINKTVETGYHGREFVVLHGSQEPERGSPRLFSSIRNEVVWGCHAPASMLASSSLILCSRQMRLKSSLAESVTMISISCGVQTLAKSTMPTLLRSIGKITFCVRLMMEALSCASL